MGSKRTSRGRAPGANLSGRLSRVCTTIADRLLYTNAISANGALMRALVIPFFRLLARVLRWWSGGWLGQQLGFGWSKQTYQASAKGRIRPSDVGDEWSQYQHGHVKLQRPPKSR